MSGFGRKSRHFIDVGGSRRGAGSLAFDVLAAKRSQSKPARIVASVRETRKCSIAKRAPATKRSQRRDAASRRVQSLHWRRETGRFCAARNIRAHRGAREASFTSESAHYRPPPPRRFCTHHCSSLRGRSVEILHEPARRTDSANHPTRRSAHHPSPHTITVHAGRSAGRLAHSSVTSGNPIRPVNRRNVVVPSSARYGHRSRLFNTYHGGYS